MKKRSSKAVTLILITSVLASCNKPKAENEEISQKVFMRADSTAPYTEVSQNYSQHNNGGSGMGSALLWYMAFRHMGGGLGYASGGLNQQSVVGNTPAKAQAYNKAVSRGGFGKTSTTTSSNTKAGS